MPNIVDSSELKVALGLTTTISHEQEAVITLFHELAEDAIKAYLGYDPCYQQHVSLFPIQGMKRQASNVLQLRHLPIRKVSEVIEDQLSYGGQASGAFTAANGAETLSAGTDYFVRFTEMPADIGGANGLAGDDGYAKTGLLERVSGFWSCFPGTVKVTYTAGYTENELAGHGSYHTAGQIKKAAIDTLLSNFKELATQATTISSGKPGNITSESLGDYSYSIDGLSSALTNFSVIIPPSAYQHIQNHRNYGILGM